MSPDYALFVGPNRPVIPSHTHEGRGIRNGGVGSWIVCQLVWMGPQDSSRLGLSLINVATDADWLADAVSQIVRA